MYVHCTGTVSASMPSSAQIRFVFIIILVVARGFPRCKPSRIPDKILENKMSENGKPDKMPDNLNRTLTLRPNL